MAGYKTLVVFAIIGVSYMVTANTDESLEPNKNARWAGAVLVRDVKAVGAANTDESLDWDKAVKWGGSIVVRESEKAAKAVRAIEIKTAACRVQLVNIANNYLASTCYDIYSLNVVIPNLDNEPIAQKAFVNATEELSKWANDVQQVLHGDPEILKAKLVAYLDAVTVGASHFLLSVKVPNEFAFNQLINVNGISILANYKLKLQAIYFKENNKAVDVKINEALADLGEAIKALPNADKRTEVLLHHLLAELSSVVERTVHKLQNWIEINEKDTKNVEIVKEVSRTLSDIYDKLNRAITGHHNAEFLKSQLHSINGLATKEIQKLAQIEYPENLGGEEYIRDSIFSALAVAVAYGENLKSASTAS